jgi:hypothetical protein
MVEKSACILHFVGNLKGEEGIKRKKKYAIKYSITTDFTSNSGLELLHHNVNISKTTAGRKISCRI